MTKDGSDYDFLIVTRPFFSYCCVTRKTKNSALKKKFTLSAKRFPQPLNPNEKLFLRMERL